MGRSGLGGLLAAMTVSVPSVDDSFGLKLLPAILSIVAGSADVISFLGLRALFVAHITGNLIIVAAHLVTGTRVDIDPVLSVPVFILALALTRVAVAGLEALGIESLRPLLLAQFVLLAGFLTLAVLSDARANPNSPTAVLAAMLGVAAMATQNAGPGIDSRGTEHGGDDDQHHPLYDGRRRGAAGEGPERARRRAPPGITHLACDYRLRGRRRPRRCSLRRGWPRCTRASRWPRADRHRSHPHEDEPPRPSPATSTGCRGSAERSRRSASAPAHGSLPNRGAALQKLDEMQRLQHPAGFPVRLAVKVLELVGEVEQSSRATMPLLDAVLERFVTWKRRPRRPGPGCNL